MIKKTLPAGLLVLFSLIMLFIWQDGLQRSNRALTSYTQKATRQVALRLESYLKFRHTTITVLKKEIEITLGDDLYSRQVFLRSAEICEKILTGIEACSLIDSSRQIIVGFSADRTSSLQQPWLTDSLFVATFDHVRKSNETTITPVIALSDDRIGSAVVVPLEHNDHKTGSYLTVMFDLKDFIEKAYAGGIMNDFRLQLFDGDQCVYNDIEGEGLTATSIWQQNATVVFLNRAWHLIMEPQVHVLEIFSNRADALSLGLLELLAVFATGMIYYWQHRESVRAWRQMSKDVYSFLNGICERMPHAMICWNNEFRIELWNVAAEQTFGWQRQQVLGKDILELLLAVENQTNVQSLFDQVLWDKTDQIRRFKTSTSFDRTVECEWFVTSLRDHNGEIIGGLSVATDLTRLLSLDAQLRQAQKMETVGLLASGIAHDFNNLLTGIMGYAEFCKSNIYDHALVQQDLNEITHNADRASALTRKLLAFSRMQLADKTIIKINSLIFDLAKMLRRFIGEDIELQVDCSEDLRLILADQNMMEQVIMNLCVNARDAMPKGGTLRITTKNCIVTPEEAQKKDWTIAGPCVEIRVSDTGVGIPAENIPQIFEPFFTTKPVEKGSGLGLAVVYGIIRQHDGIIDVQSKPGVGSTFRLLIPAITTPDATLRSENCDAVLGGKETILIAEDESSLRELAQRVLEQYGYRVITARNGEEAVQKFANQPKEVDLFVTDVVMPQMGGFEAYERLVHMRKDIPVLFLTGYQSSEFSVNEVDVSRYDILKKPYTPTEIARSVRHVLDSVRGAQAENKGK